jgi:hypothetical protein
MAAQPLGRIPQGRSRRGKRYGLVYWID